MAVVKAGLCYVSPDICKTNQTNVWEYCCGAQPNFVLDTTPGVSSG